MASFTAWSPRAAPGNLPAYARAGLPVGAQLVVTDSLRLLIAYASTAVADGHVIVVSGESGIGKTTMAGAVEAVATVRVARAVPSDSIHGTYGGAEGVLAELAEVGIDYDDVMQRLEVEGVEKFDASWDELGHELARGLGKPGPETLGA
jgi:hypothetical protein